MKWEKVEIGSLGEIVTGNTPPRKNPELYGDYIPFIKPTDMEIDRRYTSSPEECYSELGFEKYQKSLIPKGSTCVVTIGSIGKKMTQAVTDCFINQAVNAIIPNPLYDKDFVFYLLKNNLDKVKGLDSGTSSGRENVSKSAFSSIEVRVVKHLPTQRKIASILSAYDDLIENNLKRIGLLEEGALLRYKEIVRSEKMRSIKLKEVAVLNQSSLKSNSDIEKLLYVDIASVSTGSINNKTEYELNQAPGRAKRILKHQDIIWSCVRPNRKAYSFVWKPEENLIASTGFAVITSRTIPATFLYQLVTTNEFVNYLENHAKGATYPAVTASDFEDATIQVASDSVMNQYNEEAYQCFELKHNLQKQNSKLREARDILLPKLMSGQIEV
jgi:type I restriction enzyme S subunit